MVYKAHGKVLDDENEPEPIRGRILMISMLRSVTSIPTHPAKFHPTPPKIIVINTLRTERTTLESEDGSITSGSIEQAMCAGIRSTLQYAEDLNPVSKAFGVKMGNAALASDYTTYETYTPGAKMDTKGFSTDGASVTRTKQGRKPPKEHAIVKEVWGPRLGGVFNWTLLKAIQGVDKIGDVQSVNISHAMSDELARRGVIVFDAKGKRSDLPWNRDHMPPDEYPRIAIHVLEAQVREHFPGARNMSVTDIDFEKEDRRVAFWDIVHVAEHNAKVVRDKRVAKHKAEEAKKAAK